MASPNTGIQTNTASVAEQSTVEHERIHNTRVQNLPLMLNYFDGQNPQECHNFMVQFEAVAQMGHWTDAEQGIILKSRLRGQALTFLTNDPSLRHETSFKTIKSKLMDFFAEQPSLATNHMRFTTIKQQPGETVKNLVFRIDNAAMQYLSNGEKTTLSSDPMVMTIKLSKFLEALHHDLRLDVLKMDPKNYADAIEKAKCVENAQKLVTADILKANVNNFSDTASDEKINTLIQKNSENMEKIAALTSEINALRIHRNVEPLSHTVESYNSGGEQRRHKTRDLPNNLKCAFCGYNNHIMRDCRYFKQATKNNDMRQHHNYRPHQNFPSRFYGNQNRDRPRETQNYRGRNVMYQQESHNYWRDDPDRHQRRGNNLQDEVQRGRRHTNQSQYLN